MFRIWPWFELQCFQYNLAVAPNWKLQLHFLRPPSYIDYSLLIIEQLLNYFYGWMGWDGTLCVPYIFILGSEKKHNFQNNDNIALLHLRWLKKRPNSDRYVVVYCLYCLNTSKQKWYASVPCLLLSPPQPSFGLVTQRHLFPGGERQHCVTRPNNGCERD